MSTHIYLFISKLEVKRMRMFLLALSSASRISKQEGKTMGSIPSVAVNVFTAVGENLMALFPRAGECSC